MIPKNNDGSAYGVVVAVALKLVSQIRLYDSSTWFTSFSK